ncbi:MAG: hypothetical protein DWQ01_08600 [Planctomycetota bacterium]|nr:MAG: hypothetical protein DWQ01_08600 [Planctomycetota bacterium]
MELKNISIHRDPLKIPGVGFVEPGEKIKVPDHLAIPLINSEKFAAVDPKKLDQLKAKLAQAEKPAEAKEKQQQKQPQPESAKAGKEGKV